MRNKKQRASQERGITLIALVITIVIIVILAAVSISFIFGADGIINRAEQGSEDYNIESTRETLSMVLVDAVAEKQINPDYDENDFLDDFIYDREPNADVIGDEISLNGYTFKVYHNSENI